MDTNKLKEKMLGSPIHKARVYQMAAAADPKVVRLQGITENVGMYKDTFDAFKAAGFTEEQAFQLILHRGCLVDD